MTHLWCIQVIITYISEMSLVRGALEQWQLHYVVVLGVSFLMQQRCGDMLQGPHHLILLKQSLDSNSFCSKGTTPFVR